MKFLGLGILFIWVLGMAHSAKVLMIPANINSHFLYFGQVGLAMAAEGDDVTLFMPSNAKVPDLVKNSSLGMEIYPSKFSLPNSSNVTDLFLEAALATSFMSWLSAMSKIPPLFRKQQKSDCIGRFEPSVFKRIKEHKFDFVILDGVDVSCGFVFPYALDVPYAPLSVLYNSPFLFRVPALPSFTPTILAQYPNKMTFPQRIINTVLEMVYALLQSSSDGFCAEFAPHKPPMTPVELFRQSSLWLTLDEPAFNYPGPQMPNVISVGDIMGRPAKPLPDEFQEFLDSAAEGAMLVSQGARTIDFPEEIILKFCKAFQMTKMKIIWKLNDAPKCEFDPNHVMIVPWMPQNDILGHKNLHVFFTHGGLNSAIESIYHGKPMLAMPFAIDQPLNAAVIAHRKFGLRIDIADFTAEELVHCFDILQTDQEILHNVALASKVLRDKPDTPGQRASFWVNHVVKYGHEHLRTGAFELNIAQFYMVDIVLFFLFIMLLLIGIVFCGLRICCICCKKCIFGQSKSKKKTE